MRDIFEIIGGLLVIVLFMWIFGSVVCWDINPAHWPMYLRLFLIIFTICFLIIIANS